MFNELMGWRDGVVGLVLLLIRCCFWIYLIVFFYFWVFWVRKGIVRLGNFDGFLILYYMFRGVNIGNFWS